MTRIGIVGLGNFGTAIGNLIARNDYRVLGWDINSAVINEVNQQHRNSQYLKDIILSENLSATDSLEDLFADCTVIFVAIPARFIRQTLAPFTATESHIVVNMAKGVDRTSMQTASHILREVLPDAQHLVLSGPSIANEFAKDLPTSVVIAGSDKAVYERVAPLLATDYFATQYSSDIAGTEWGGIIKNVYAIGLGLLHGTTGVNLQAVYLTNALAEMGLVFEMLGSTPSASYRISGMGDFLATALSPHSHNRSFGVDVANDPTYLEKAKSQNHVPEGFPTLAYILNVAQKSNMSLPIAEAIHETLEGTITSQQFAKQLLKTGSA